MAEQRPERVSIGFQASLPLAVRLPRERLDELREALRSKQARESSWFELEAADGTVLLDLAQVVYVRLESDEHRVGFSSA